MLKNGFTEAVGIIALLKGKNLQKIRKIPAQSCFPRSRLLAFVLEEDVFAKKKCEKSYAHIHKYTPLQGWRSKGPGALSPQILADKVTLSHPGGRLCALHYYLPNPGFSNLPRALHFLHNCYYNILTYKGKHNTAGTIKRMRICVSLRRFFRIWLAKNYTKI